MLTLGLQRGGERLGLRRDKELPWPRQAVGGQLVAVSGQVRVGSCLRYLHEWRACVYRSQLSAPMNGETTHSRLDRMAHFKGI